MAKQLLRNLKMTLKKHKQQTIIYDHMYTIFSIIFIKGEYMKFLKKTLFSSFAIIGLTFSGLVMNPVSGAYANSGV